MNKEQTRQWIESGPSKELIDAAEQFGRQLAKPERSSDALSTSQIRQVFTKLKNIESKSLDETRLGDFLMLKPFIAYAAGRQNNVAGLQKLKGLVCDGIDCVVDAKGVDLQCRFRNFVKLFEAVLAYHRAAGGR
jgi:CRISPR-associated protein Csm2